MAVPDLPVRGNAVVSKHRNGQKKKTTALGALLFAVKKSSPYALPIAYNGAFILSKFNITN